MEYCKIVERKLWCLCRPLFLCYVDRAWDGAFQMRFLPTGPTDRHAAQALSLGILKTFKVQSLRSPLRRGSHSGRRRNRAAKWDSTFVALY